MEDTPEAGAPEGDDRVEAIPRSLWERVKEDPARAPEHIALAAADRFAPAAERWAERMRAHHSPAELAGIARRRHVHLSRLEGAVAGLGGGFVVAPDLAALAWIQGRMVFFIAAAHGYDPRHPMRPAELLALQDIYATPAEARATLDGLGRPMAVHYVSNRASRDEAIVGRLLKVAGRTIAKRAVYRVVPILASPVSAIQNARVTGRLGDRAIAYYGGPPGVAPTV